MTDVEMAVRAADKVEREINRESLRAAESQGGTTITIGHKPLPIMTCCPDGWLEVPEIEDTPPEPPTSSGGGHTTGSARGGAARRGYHYGRPECWRCSYGHRGSGVLQGVAATPAASSTPPLAVRRSKY
jgi:hypothetical protein